MKDPVLLDEARHDREQTKAAERWQECLQKARDELNCGHLDDEIRDLVADEPIDAVAIALAVLEAIDEGTESLSDALMFQSLYLRDFRATIDGVVERRAERLMEDY